MKCLALIFCILYLFGCAEHKSNSRQNVQVVESKRNLEEVKTTIETNKIRVFELYAAELEFNKNIRGVFIFKFTIMPNGKVSHLSLIKSELGVQSLNESILEIIKTTDFGEKQVSEEKIEYKFVFLPE